MKLEGINTNRKCDFRDSSTWSNVELVDTLKQELRTCQQGETVKLRQADLMADHRRTWTGLGDDNKFKPLKMPDEMKSTNQTTLPSG
ncbi:unnamed protein product [Enterobius vermicularis]|uniref:Uncharacterized protein n=1 Tax=Enterobius vermicularis TaxID=51028 RepID=A0A0N4VJG4_ENTVE|nr:unnamed protein product [Enterobius vermicularis]